MYESYVNPGWYNVVADDQPLSSSPLSHSTETHSKTQKSSMIL